MCKCKPASYEHLVVTGPGNGQTGTVIQNFLNARSREGWELVSWFPCGPYATCIFKRPFQPTTTTKE